MSKPKNVVNTKYSGIVNFTRIQAALIGYGLLKIVDEYEKSELTIMKLGRLVEDYLNEVFPPDVISKYQEYRENRDIFKVHYAQIHNIVEEFLDLDFICVKRKKYSLTPLGKMVAVEWSDLFANVSHGLSLGRK